MPNESNNPNIKLEKWTYDLNNNQKVIEVKKDIKIEKGTAKENFETFRSLKRELWKRKEPGAVIALVDYIGDNSNGFTFGLSMEKFKKEYGYAKTAYHNAVEALIFYGILELTNRRKIDPKGIQCPVYVFRGDKPIDELPKEKYKS